MHVFRNLQVTVLTPFFTGEATEIKEFKVAGLSNPGTGYGTDIHTEEQPAAGSARSPVCRGH